MPRCPIVISGVVLPRAMVLDLVYNHGVRRLFGAPPLPPTPRPRRCSYALSATLLTGSALAFTLGHPAWGHLLGGAVAVGGAILTVTLWCLGSWLYRPIPGHSLVGRGSATIHRGNTFP